jgi:hypothetical protein
MISSLDEFAVISSVRYGVREALKYCSILMPKLFSAKYTVRLKLLPPMEELNL